MSSITEAEKRYFEAIFEMRCGLVLNYSDATFATLFRRFNITIHSNKYEAYGRSKAKKMRSFWEQENDELVGSVLSEMLQAYEAECVLNAKPVNTIVFDKCNEIVDRLKKTKTKLENANTLAFLNKEFIVPNLHKLPIEQSIIPIIESRLKEVTVALEFGAYLSVIFLCGSVLEAVLLGKAKIEPKTYNSCKVAPKDADNKVKPFKQWTLSNFIDVSCAVGIIQPDIKKFGHGLRDFRNYIHPYQQMESGFLPDEHTAKVCFHVLKAALASVAGER